MSEEVLEKHLSGGQILTGFAIMLVSLWGIYTFLDSRPTSNAPQDFNAPTSTTLKTVSDWRSASDYKRLQAAEYFVETYKDKLAYPDKMRASHNMNMMKCITHNAKSAPLDDRVSDLAQICVGAINLSLNQ